ncbi:AkeP protein [Xylaria digitata]|nr:AkeP protein [Xylaria digitata]
MQIAIRWQTVPVLELHMPCRTCSVYMNHRPAMSISTDCPKVLTSVQALSNAAFLGLLGRALGQLDAIPKGFSTDKCAGVSNQEPLLAVIPGTFNRSNFDAPCAAVVSDERVAAINQQINQTSFIAYDERFFDIIGPDATIEKLIDLPFQVHEAPCHTPEQDKLFFYLLDLKTNGLIGLRTNPPTWNIHGCVHCEGKLHVVTDGGPKEVPYLATIDPKTWDRTTLLNNYYERPFISFNDIEMDREGNYYLTDSLSGQSRHLNPYSPLTAPMVYFVDGKTLHPKQLTYLPGNANGITLSPDGKTLYLADTGSSRVVTVRRDELGYRDLWAFNFAISSVGKKLPLLTNKRLLTRATEYFYDGIRASRNGYVFGAGGSAIDVIDPESGWILESLRFGSGGQDPVNIVFGQHEMWAVGKGGVCHIKNVRDMLAHNYKRCSSSEA